MKFEIPLPSDVQNEMTKRLFNTCLVLLVLVEGYGEAVADVEDALGRPRAEEKPHHPLGVPNLTHPVEVIHHGEEDQRVNDHLRMARYINIALEQYNSGYFLVLLLL